MNDNNHHDTRFLHDGEFDDRLNLDEINNEDGKTRKLPARAALPIDERHAEITENWMLGLAIGGQRDQHQWIIDDHITFGRTLTDTQRQDHLHVDLNAYHAMVNGVSRIHAGIYVRSNCLSLQDLGSTNGTFLNGYRVSAYTEVPIQEQDMIEFGNLRLQVVFAYPMPDDV